MDLFEHRRQHSADAESPLANRMRPRTLDEFVGQQHIIGPGRLLRRAIEADQLSSLIFYGPPGVGKTTLARIIANTTRSHFITLNAVLSGVKEVRAAIDEALERRRLYNQRTTLFVDEVHRWNKAQQDALLPHVENGVILLIGATTENPYFEVNKALVSRSRIFQLKPLEEADLRQVAQQALTDPERGYGALAVTISEDALAHLVNVANGDARSVLNALELAVETTQPDADDRIVIDMAVAEESIQRRAVLYDKDGDVHYDTISAFIKSLRGSDADAALYWLAKMVYAGEDPRFIFRRMGIFASEDVGLADPQAARIVESCWALYERIGLPEGQFPLAQAALYLATAPKSNSVLAYFDALGAVQKEREADVPTHLKDANRDKEGFGHGAGYLYPHAYRDHWVAQQYLPAALQGKVFYTPGQLGYERAIQEQVARRREAQLAAMLEQEETPGEILTSSPARPGRDAWLRRAAESAGRQLETVRDHLFALAQVQRHHLVLDIKAAGGLLLWEAARRAPEGGVWGLVDTPDEAELLQAQSRNLPELERPRIVVRGYWPEASATRFDRVIGRNPFNRLDNLETLHLARRVLLPDGRLCLAQVAPRRGQRLYALLDWSGVASARQAIVDAEEKMWADSADPLVNWDLPDLEAAVLAAGFVTLQVEIERANQPRHITRLQLDKWLGDSPEAIDSGSYTQKLRAHGLSLTAARALAALARRQLQDQVIPWQSSLIYLSARLPQ